MATSKHEENQITEFHKDILEDICLKLKNCADCHNEETGKVECCPMRNLYAELNDVTADTFFMEPYNSKIHTAFAEIASKHGYEMTFTGRKDQELVKFYRKQ